MTLRSKNIGFCIAIGLLSLVIMMITALNIGVYEFGKSSAYEVFWKHISGNPSLSLSEKYVIWEVRASRIVMAVLIGSMLAVSGATLQGMFKNPLATGDLIGLTSGATLLAAIAIVLGHTFQDYLPEWIRFSLVSVSAFLGALLSMILVYRISTSGGKTNVVMMLLSLSLIHI